MWGHYPTGFGSYRYHILNPKPLCMAACTSCAMKEKKLLATFLHFTIFHYNFAIHSYKILAVIHLRSFV